MEIWEKINLFSKEKSPMNCWYHSVRKQSCIVRCCMAPSLCSLTCQRPGFWVLLCDIYLLPGNTHTHTHNKSQALPKWNCHLHCSLVLLFLCPGRGSAHTTVVPFSLGHPFHLQPPVTMSSNGSYPGATGWCVRSEWGVSQCYLDVGCCYSHSWYPNGGWFLLASPT